MVSTGKVFRLREVLELSNVEDKLKNFRREEEYDEEPLHTKLLTEVRDLSFKKDRFEGTYIEDSILYIFHRGKRIPTPKTIEVAFAFIKFKEMSYLIIMERKLVANNIANRMSEALFSASGYITEVKISPEVFRKFHEQNPEDTKVIFFDNVDIPNISKLSLYGSELLNTALYNDYCSHGDIWYIVATSKKSGNTVGITRNGIVTVFSTIQKEGYINFVENEVLPLLQL